ncbi:hypothetical protein T4D_1406, partial [Trichinella pseudospiralis]
MKTRTIRSRVENKPHVQFPMGPYSVGLVCGYFKRVKLSHTTHDTHCIHMRKHVIDPTVMHGEDMQIEKSTMTMDRMNMSID